MVRALLGGVLGCDYRHGAHLRLSNDFCISLSGFDLEIPRLSLISDPKLLYPEQESCLRKAPVRPRCLSS